MLIASDTIERTCPEREIYDSILTLDDKRILELGCGRAELTRAIASQGRGRQLVALEVDEIQHAKNLALPDLPNVAFKLAGAQAIPEPDNSFDVVFMFKSLHHVPVELIATSLAEIRRVLKPGGYAYISEPIFAGKFNEVLRLFHDEGRVREAAFAGVKQAVANGQFELAQEIFFNAPMFFENFEAFETLVIRASHSNHRLTPEVFEAVKARFETNMTSEGAHFAAPMRIDLLRKQLLH